MKKIYIVMVELPTFINKIVCFFTGFKYTHFSLSFTEKLDKMYSFQIKNMRTVLVGGLMEETEIHYFHGKKNINIKEIVYEIPLSSKDYTKIYNYVENIKNDNEYIFNYVSAWLMFPFGGVKAYKAYHCVEFISEIVNLIPDIKLPKKAHKMYPKDLYMVLAENYSSTEKVIFSNNYKIPQNDIFFKKIKNVQYMKKAIYSIREAFCRVIFKRVSKNFDYKKVNFYEENCRRK